MMEYLYPIGLRPAQFSLELESVVGLPKEDWIEPRDNGTALFYSVELSPEEKLLLDQAVLDHIPIFQGRVTNEFADEDGDTSIRLQNNPGSDEDVVIIKTDGKDRVTIGGTTFNSKMLEMVDDTGSDVRLHQIGENGSAFHILKRSLGTWEEPTAVTEGTKIGGYAFQAEDGNDGLTFTIGAEMASFAIEDHDENVGGQEMRFGVTPKGTKGRQFILKLRGDSINLPQHTSSRNDGIAESILFVDENGDVKVGTVNPPVDKFSQQSAVRVTCYKNGEWVTSDDDQFGANHHIANEKAGSGVVPISEWEHQGIMVRPGEVLESLLLSARLSSGDLSDMEVVLRYRYPKEGSDYSSGVSSDSEMDHVTLLHEKFWKPGTDTWGPDFTGTVREMHRRFVNLDYEFQTDGWLTMYFRGIGEGDLNFKDSLIPVTRRYNFRSST